jgi:hypothetical protein
MDRQQQIEAFSLAAHRLAIVRIRDRPAAIEEALATLQRWRTQNGAPAHCEPYWQEWERLLRGDVDGLERAVCADSDNAAVLRSVSPLGRMLGADERKRLLRAAREPV